MSAIISGVFPDSQELTKKKRAKSFFEHPADYVAEKILGDYLVLKRKNTLLAGKIVETEGYVGVDDDASHSFGAKVTARNQIMYKEAGLIYVYFIYGKFWCFNIVVSKPGDPQAVLIRALEPIAGIRAMKKNRGISDIKRLTSGPCRWTQSFAVDRTFLGKDINGDEIFVSRGLNKKFDIVKAKRVGIDYATRSKNRLLRFYIKGSSFVSRA